ncbi:MAG: hypothetical protein ACRD3I_15220, partial [Terriglobales bacterium]
VLFEAILNKAPVSSIRLNPELPPKLEEIINKALEKDREVRFQAARDILVDLKRLKRDTDSGRTGATSTAVTTAAPAVAAPTVVSARRGHWLRWAAPAAAAVVVLALALVFLLRSPVPPPRVLGTSQITNDGRPKVGGIGDIPPPLLTDGGRIYFVQSLATNPMLLQASVEGGETVPIPLTTRFNNLINISPTRPELMLGGPPESQNSGGFWLLPLPGGQPRRLGELTGADATWSPDGNQIFYTLGEDLYLAQSDGTGSRKLASAHGALFWPRVSPDGRLVRFSALDTRLATRALWEVRADGTSLRELFPGWNPSSLDCCGNWTPDGKYYVFQSTR